VLYRHIKNIFKLDSYKLILILVLGFYLTFIPHLDYPYPLHVDEWVQMAYSETILQAGDMEFVEPFYGEVVEGLTGTEYGMGYYLSIGSHLFWASVHQITDIPWLIIYRFFPSLFFMIIVLSAYILGRKQGFGLEAAFFTALMPTTLGILGPSFLVPVILALLFIPLALFVAFNFNNVGSYLVIFIFTCFLLLAHAATAVGLVIGISPYILFTIKDNWKHSLALAAAVVLPFVAPLPWIFRLSALTAQSLFEPQTLIEYVVLPSIIEVYGYLPAAFCIVGVVTLMIKGESKNRGLASGLLLMLAMMVVFYQFHYGVPIMFYRGFMYAMLLIGIIAGAGLASLKNLAIPSKLLGWQVLAWSKNYLNAALLLICLALILATTIPSRLNTPYYQMIDEQDYQAFVWIKENLGEEYNKAILDPWKATAFTAITGKKVYSRIQRYPKDTDKRAQGFFDEGCKDTEFLRENGITIVYSIFSCENPDLIELRPRVYVLRDPN
jgi:hypothetical protein